MIPSTGELIAECWQHATPELMAWATTYFATRPNAKKRVQLELSAWRKSFAEGRTPTDRSTDDGLRYCRFLDALIGPVPQEVYWARDRKDAAMSRSALTAGIVGVQQGHPGVLELLQELDFGYQGHPAIRQFTLAMMAEHWEINEAVQAERRNVREAQITQRRRSPYLYGRDEYVDWLVIDYDTATFDWKKASQETENARRTTPDS